MAAGADVGKGPAFAFAVVTCAIKLASALAVLLVGQTLLRMDYHSANAATSLPFLIAMAGAPLVAALISLASSVEFRLMPTPLQRLTKTA